MDESPFVRCMSKFGSVIATRNFNIEKLDLRQF
jgi:hypothetical protein